MKMYLVVDFDSGYYEGEQECTYLKAVSTDLLKLYEAFKSNQPPGQLFVIDESVFNTALYMHLSEDRLLSQEGVEVLGNFSFLVSEYFKR